MIISSTGDESSEMLQVTGRFGFAFGSMIAHNHSFHCQKRHLHRIVWGGFFCASSVSPLYVAVVTSHNDIVCSAMKDSRQCVLLITSGNVCPQFPDMSKSSGEAKRPPVPMEGFMPCVFTYVDIPQHYQRTHFRWEGLFMPVSNHSVIFLVEQLKSSVSEEGYQYLASKSTAPLLSSPIRIRSDLGADGGRIRQSHHLGPQSHSSRIVVMTNQTL